MSHYIEQYTANLPPFSRDICLKLDELIHQSVSDFQEGKKWDFCAYWTENGVILGISPAKEFVTFTFLEGALLKDEEKLFNYGSSNARNRSIKFYGVDEVNKNAAVIKRYIKEAADNNAKGLKVDMKIQTINIPTDFKQALKDAGLLEIFEKQTYTMRKEYILWIVEAKKLETRARRIEQSLAKIAAD